MPGTARAADVLKMKQAMAIVSYLKGEDRVRDAAIVAVSAGFGLRISDALAFKWEDVLDETGEVRPVVRVREQKTGRERFVRVFPFVARALKEWKAKSGGEGLIFPGRDGNPLDRRTAWVMVKKIARDMGLRAHISTHSFRKAFCDYVYEHTRDPVATARITGHSNPAQLMHYIGRLGEGEEAGWERMTLGL